MFYFSSSFEIEKNHCKICHDKLSATNTSVFGGKTNWYKIIKERGPRYS